MKRSPLWPTAEKFPAMIALVRDQAYPVLDHQPDLMAALARLHDRLDQ